MEEPVKKVDRYTFQFENGETIIISAEILNRYFRTLISMLEDFPVEENVEQFVIPLPGDIKKPIIQWIIDAHVLYDMHPTGDVVSLDQLYEKALNLNTVLRLFDPLVHLKFSLNNEMNGKVNLEQLVEIIHTLNWLDAREILVLAVDYLYKMHEKMTTQELELLIQAGEETTTTTTKRTREGKLSESNELPLTPHYKHNLLIQRVIRQKLPADLILADKSIPKYITPFSSEDDVRFFIKPDGLYKYIYVDYFETVNSKPKKITGPSGKPLLIVSNDNKTLCLTTEGLYDNTIDGWREREVDGEVLAISMSDDHAAILTTNGLFVSLDNLNTFNQIQIDERVLAINSGNHALYIITSQQVHILLFNSDDEEEAEGGALDPLQPFPLVTIELVGGSILSFASGQTHSMLITESGLFGRGSNDFGQLGLPDTWIPPKDYDSAADFIKIENLPGKPLSVYCSNFYTVLLTTEGLFAAGHNAYDQLSIRDRHGPINVWGFTRMIGLSGEVKSVLCRSRFVLVLTTTGLYVSGIANLMTKLADKEGFKGRMFRRLPFEMDYFPSPGQFILIEADDEEEERRRKQRRLQCLSCYGEARFLAKSDAAFCSKICLYRSQL